MRRLLPAVAALTVAVSALTSPPAAVAAGVIPGFEVFCFYDHTLRDDPIMAPGRPGGAPHLHDFAGNTTTNADSTYTSLRAGPSNCELPADTAAYWAPVLYSHGRVVHPDRLHAYYRWGNIPDVASIRPVPAGLRMIAGNMDATTPQDTHVVGWNCGVQGQAQYDHPISCHPGEKVVLHVFFPNCWDGVNLDSADHQSHMAYSRFGRCPVDHPVPIPRLSEDYGYPIIDGGGITLASGSYMTAHADFINAWDQSVMVRLTRECVNAGVQCGPQR